MPQNTYKAQLNYYDPTYGWANEGTVCQGTWTGAGGNRTGVLYFPGLSNLKGKIINSAKITVTAKDAGNGAWKTKTAVFYASKYQGGINTSAGAGHRKGSQIGSIAGSMYSNTSSYDVAFLASLIAAGNDTFCIYNTGTDDYFKWSAASLEVTWQEPATQPTLSDGTVEMGKSVTISTSAVNSAYTHNIWAAFGEEGIAIAERVSTGATWTPDISLASQIPNATSGIGTIYCDTYSGSTLLGTKSVSITLTIPSSVVPSAGKLTAAVTEDTSGTGQFVRGMGKAAVSLSGAAGVYGSTIKSYSISGGSASSANEALTTGVLQAAGEITFTATVTDSRGRSAQTTCTIKVISYNKPGVSSCRVYRCDASGTAKNAGTYYAVEVNASYSAITGNTLTITTQYKQQSAGSYGSAVAVTNGQKKIVGDGAISTSKTYDVLVIVKDKFNTITLSYTVPTKSVLLSFLGNLGAAIGKVAELKGWFDVNLNMRVRGTMQADSYTPVNRDDASSNPIVLVPRVTYGTLGLSGSSGSEYFKQWLIWVCKAYPNKYMLLCIGTQHPNSVGIVLCHIYNTSTVNAAGLPEYATGKYFALGGGEIAFGTVDYNFYLK